MTVGRIGFVAAFRVGGSPFFVPATISDLKSASPLNGL